MSFTSISRIPERQLFGASIRGRYAHGDRMTMGDVLLAPDTPIPMHQHPHEQITFLLQGRMEFVVGDDTLTMEAGDIAIIPADCPHGGRTLAACRVIDVFAPARDDYR